MKLLKIALLIFFTSFVFCGGRQGTQKPGIPNIIQWKGGQLAKQHREGKTVMRNGKRIGILEDYYKSQAARKSTFII